MGRIICELERIYGIKQGNNQRTPTMSESTKTQESLAKEFMGLKMVETDCTMFNLLHKVI